MPLSVTFLTSFYVLNSEFTTKFPFLKRSFEEETRAKVVISCEMSSQVLSMILTQNVSKEEYPLFY
jgi:hypothetical protein